MAMVNVRNRRRCVCERVMSTCVTSRAGANVCYVRVITYVMAARGSQARAASDAAPPDPISSWWHFSAGVSNRLIDYT